MTEAEITLGKLLKKAAQRETAAWLLYSNMSRKAAQTAVRDAFRKIVQQEKEHQNLLEQYLEGGISEGVLSLGLVIDIEITAHLEQPRIYPDMNPADILMLAIQREQASHDLYFCLARIHPKGKVKQLLEEMARQELEHKRQLDLFDAEITFLPG